ncbi:MAG: N-acetyl-gamma-glutamyl-phosphate reductase [Lentisphaerae bacterium]|nr:N-acetyl-gamma-glutamyl-phosphate reductase [Lentisphaerota bacterium]HQL87685.1 N-acetyl-gamma-glutamyl-phosphate reductase [Lentisphaeria bacterium]
MTKTSVAIVGASGYAGEELLRLLLRHPAAELTAATSRQYAGQAVGAVFPRYRECQLPFINPDAEQIAGRAEVAFLALPHGLAAEYAVPLLARGVKVIDISADFRLRDTEVYARYYKTSHPAPELLSRAVYGLPERYADAIRTADLIACPGCYPTSVILPVAALLHAKLVETTGIEAISLSGVTGAGRKVDLPYLFPECNESIRPYAVTGHRHLPEIEQELAVAAGVPANAIVINFVPHLLPVNRGILSTILLQARPGTTAETAVECLRAAYDGKPFVRILNPGELADTKHVTMTNMCEIGCAFDARTGRLIVSSAIDNLTKGASGQAVQCLNLSMGLPEDAGLN